MDDTFFIMRTYPFVPLNHFFILLVLTLLHRALAGSFGPALRDIFFEGFKVFGTNRILFMALAVVIVVAGCMSPEGDTAEDKRQAIHQMQSETLAKLYELEPDARTNVEQAVGYAVFSNVGVNLLFVSAGNGYGVVEDQRAGKKTYMKMASGGLGLGLGVKDFRGIFVFTSEGALKDFVESGWDASAQADAAAKSGEKGRAWAGAVDVAPGIKLYQITEHGLALQATIQGTKYWKADDLNS